MRKVLTACELCAWSCGMEVDLKAGRIEDVSGMDDHPLNRGRLCPKGASVRDYVYSEDRILHPLRKEGDEWREISWEEAFSTLIEKLQETRDNYSPKSLATIIGMPILLGGSSTVSFIRRFMDVYGSPNCFSPESICYRHQIIGQTLTLGKFCVPDVSKADCIVVWGHNPHNSKPPLAWQIDKAEGRGVRIIVIDPRRTRVADMADIHLQVEPGTDTALALGLMKAIVENELFDEEFVEEYCTGIPELKEHLEKQSMESIEDLTRVDRTDIRKSAELFANSDGSCIVQGVNSPDQHVTGVQNSRAIAILHALTGNIDSEGGFVRSSRFHTNYLRKENLLDEIPIGIEQHPLFYQVWDTYFGEGQSMYLYDALLGETPYPIETLIVSGSNPLITWPNTQKLAKGLKNVDFIAVMDLFMTETAEAADLFLPVASFMEREELCDYYSVIFGIPYVMLRKKVIEPRGESMSDVKFWLELAKGMGGDFDEHFPWKNPRDILKHVLKPSDHTLSELLDEHPEGIMFGDVQYGEHEKYQGFKTPSGKIELYSETLKNQGHDPLPTFKEPRESIRSEKAEKFPLILTTGSRLLPFTHSQMRNIPKLKKLYKAKHSTQRCFAEINPVTAGKFDIKNGEEVKITTQRGEIKATAKVTEDIIERVVNIPHGWNKGNVNILTDNEPADPITGAPDLKSELCRISKTRNF